jgi:hypothetical protein
MRTPVRLGDRFVPLSPNLLVLTPCSGLGLSRIHKVKGGTLPGYDHCFGRVAANACAQSFPLSTIAEYVTDLACSGSAPI